MDQAKWVRGSEKGEEAQLPGKEEPVSLGPPKNSNSYRDTDHSSSCFMSSCHVPGFMPSSIYHFEQQGEEDRHEERAGH